MLGTSLGKVEKKGVVCRAAWSWLKILHDSEDTKGSWLTQEWEGLDFVPAVEVKLQLRNRRPETLKNLVL